jgi:hypothetical protein
VPFLSLFTLNETAVVSHDLSVLRLYPASLIFPTTPRAWLRGAFPERIRRDAEAHECKASL